MSALSELKTRLIEDAARNMKMPIEAFSIRENPHRAFGFQVFEIETGKVVLSMGATLGSDYDNPKNDPSSPLYDKDAPFELYHIPDREKMLEAVSGAMTKAMDQIDRGDYDVSDPPRVRKD